MVPFLIKTVQGNSIRDYRLSIIRQQRYPKRTNLVLKTQPKKGEKVYNLHPNPPSLSLCAKKAAALPSPSSIAHSPLRPYHQPFQTATSSALDSSTSSAIIAPSREQYPDDINNYGNPWILTSNAPVDSNRNKSSHPYDLPSFTKVSHARDRAHYTGSSELYLTPTTQARHLHYETGLFQLMYSDQNTPLP